MQQTVRTTIRIRQDLFEQSRRIAFEQGTSLQDVINTTLEKGFREISNLTAHQQALQTIDEVREKLKNSGGPINTRLLLKDAKREREKRDTKRIRVT